MSVDYRSGAIIGCRIDEENLPKDFDFYEPTKVFSNKLKKLGLILVRGENSWSGTYESAIIGLKKFHVVNSDLASCKILKAADLIDAHTQTKKVLEELGFWDDAEFGLHVYMTVS